MRSYPRFPGTFSFNAHHQANPIFKFDVAPLVTAATFEPSQEELVELKKAVRAVTEQFLLDLDAAQTSRNALRAR